MKILIFIFTAFLFLSCSKNDESNNSSSQNIQSFSHNNVNRTYSIYFPSSYNGTVALPLIFNFHGFGGNITEYKTYASMEALAERENFILVYPQGTLTNGYTHWNPSLPSPTNKSNADDLGFIESLIQNLSNNYAIDSKRIYACGYSNGGMMSFGLANHKSNLFAAVASLSGAMLETQISPDHPMPVLILHGTSDGVLPYYGNNDYNSVETTLNFWVNFNKTDSLPNSNVVSSNGITVQYDFYGNGDNGVSVEHYKINNGNHEWFNLNFNGKNTDELIWEFFSKYDIDGLL
mgnify:CR=1 FL=1